MQVAVLCTNAPNAAQPRLKKESKDKIILLMSEKVLIIFLTKIIFSDRIDR